MNGLTFRAVRRDEVALASTMSLAAFGGSPEDQDATEERFERHRRAGELWGVAGGESGLIGVCRLERVDHFFGGRPVPCMDVAGVAVPREHRRRGVATALMEAAIAWGAHDGLALSLLFPGVPTLYRRLGWEVAGTFPRYRLDASLSPPAAERMRQAAASDWPAIEACHERFAAMLNGAGRRSAARWRQLRRAERQLVLDGAGGVEAYVMRYRGAQPGESADDPASVDWAALTPRALRAVGALLAGDIMRDTVVRGAGADLWAAWSDTWDAPPTDGLRWMARHVRLADAIAARGFPAGVDGSVTLSVDDRVVTEARGPWRLEVSTGRGVLLPARDAEVVMEARAVGPLFTGYRTPRDLALAGLLDGPGAALDALGAMFAGPSPVALDFF